MQRREFIVAGGATAAALAGCLGDSNGNDDNPQNPGDEEDGASPENNPNGEDPEDERTVTVRGSGEVVTDPDMASFSATVEERGEEAEEVRQEVQSQVNDIIDAVVEAGVDEDDVTTRRFHVFEDRVEPDPEEREEGDELEPETVFVGMHDIDIEVKDVDTVGEVVDVAIDAGASRVSRIRFDLTDEAREDLRNDALEEAIDAATNEADFIAGEVDAEVAEVAHVDAAGTSVSRTYLEMEEVAMDDAADDGTTFQPDDVTVSANVEIVARIE